MGAAGATKAIGGANDHRHFHLPIKHMGLFGGMVHNLIPRHQSKVHGHDLGNGAHPAHRRTNGDANNAFFGNRRIKNAIWKFLGQPAINAIGAAAFVVINDILTPHHHIRVTLHFFAQGLGNRLCIGYFGHVYNKVKSVKQKVQSKNLSFYFLLCTFHFLLL